MILPSRSIVSKEITEDCMKPTLKEQLHIDDEPDDDFIKFLRFCADRLNKDEPVQAIWLAWKELTAQK